MYAFKRIIAFSIDYALMFFATGLLYGFTAKKLSPLLQKTEILAAYSHSALSVGILMLLPILVLGTLSGALGWTPGKLLCRLRVHNYSGKPPGVVHGILREIVKYIGSSFMFFGVLWALYGLITSEQTFYDDWLNLTVTDMKPVGLTETQKKWREFQKEEKSKK